VTAKKKTRDKKHELWTRRSGRHEANAAGEGAEADVGSAELAAALAQSVTTSCARIPMERREACGIYDHILRSEPALAIPHSLLTEQTGRKWLEDWYITFERCLEGVPAAVARGETLAPVDIEAGERLHMALNQVCTNGVMPDFSDGGALAHYVSAYNTSKLPPSALVKMNSEAGSGTNYVMGVW
jgi:hypothetical protein